MKWVRTTVGQFYDRSHGVPLVFKDRPMDTPVSIIPTADLERLVGLARRFGGKLHGEDCNCADCQWLAEHEKGGE